MTYLDLIREEKVLAGMHPGISGDISPDLCGDISPDLRGDISGLRGDISGLRGNISGLRGDITGLCGDISGLAPYDIYWDEPLVNIITQLAAEAGEFDRMEGMNKCK